jgi:choline dehydrogenase-like flavoprotein
VSARYNVVVVGGGTAGCVLAARLSEDPERSVCLAEAGPDYGPYEQGRWPEDLLDARALALSHTWETDREDRSQLRARVLGGCSAHNACVVLEGTPADYDEWGSRWTYAELRPHLERARHELRTRLLGDDELSPWHRSFVEACGDDAIVHPVNAVGSVRWNAAFAYLDPARGRPNLTILGDALVDRIAPEPRRVLTTRGELEAGAVVLTAGAYGTPGILLRSGIGPGLELDLPVGEGLTDHVGIGFGWEPTALAVEELDRFAERHPVFMAQVTVRALGGDLFLFPALDPGWEISAAVFAMKPFSRGRVTLTSPDPTVPLRIEHGFLSDERDVATLAEGAETLRALVGSSTIRRYADRELRPGAEVGAETHVRAAARGFFHPVATCAMGSVVGADGRVLGTDDLYVADASIMPTIPRANTNLTAAAVAERIAQLLPG